MSYATRANLVPNLMSERDLVIATNGGSGTAVAEVTAVTDAKLAGADAEINAYLAVRYDLTALVEAEVPALLREIAAVIARYRLLTIGGRKPSDQVVKEYDDAIALLKAVRDGKATLGLTAAGADPGVASASGVSPRLNSQAPVFGRANMRRF